MQRAQIGLLKEVNEEDFHTKCAILLQGANRLPLLQRKADFEIGVGFIPYWPHITERPFNLCIGGASFWVMSGFPDDVYRGVVKFLIYLSQPSIYTAHISKLGF